MAMRKLLVGLTAAMLISAGGAAFGAAAAPTTTSCTGDLPGSVTGNVVVPAGGHCNIQGLNVTGNVLVQPGGTLISGSGSMLGGNVVSGGAGSAWGPFGYSFSVLICNTTIGGSVSVSKSTDNVIIGDDDDCGSNNIARSVSVTSNTGGVEMSNNPSPDACPIGNCGIGGSVTVVSNTGSTHDDAAAAEITANRIAGSLICSGNSAMDPDGGNVVAGTKTGQCASL
jgi:hypothetical protein